ncbi:hypothetical protein Pan216_03820 [Planctomycetes bacterium Pan216]|uniref:Uncharacterized protein n=1 Tax=Kolteria novifilia TaxID=2527975 RepID=A0A518AXU9_9BACT|nr:hypothetical protein Pan216_03820 [Planctomycetes bacterium Pan216]
MPSQYIEDLPLRSEEKQKLSELCAPSPAALLGMMNAAPEDFRRLLGGEAVQNVLHSLRRMVSKSDEAIVDAPAPSFHASGAILGRRPPNMPPSKVDFEERERLFQELQRLRQGDDQPATRQRAAEIEKRLQSLLDADAQ